MTSAIIPDPQVKQKLTGDSTSNFTRLLDRRAWFFAFLILLFFVPLLLIYVNNFHMRPDEELTYRYLNQGLPVLFETLWIDTHPPAWWLTFYAWQETAGLTEFAGRYLSVLLTLMTLAVVYQIGKQWFGDARYGLFAMLTVGLNGLFLTYALEIRPYPLIFLLTSVNMLLFTRWLKQVTWRAAILYGISITAMMLVHYHTVFLVFTEIFFVLAARQLTRERLKQGLGALVLAFVLWSPWLPFVINQFLHVRDFLPDATEWGNLSLSAAPTRPTNFGTVQEWLDLLGAGYPVVYLAILIVGIILLRKKWGFWLALSWAVIPTVFVLIVNLWVAVYLHRYLAYTSIGFGLAIGFTFAAMPRRIGFTLQAIFVFFSLLIIPSALPNRVPFRNLLGAVSQKAEPGDVIYYRFAGEDGFPMEQIQRYLSPELQANAVFSVEEAQEAQRIWFVTQEWFNEDVRSAFDALETTHRVLDVEGDCTSDWCYLLQLMVAPPLEEPITFGEEMTFRGAVIEQVNSGELGVDLWWILDEPPHDNYSIGVHLLSEDGVLVGQSDQPLSDPGRSVTETIQMQPDTVYIDERSLSISNLPEGDYQLGLVIYNWQDGSRLLLEDARDFLTLDTITIPITNSE